MNVALSPWQQETRSDAKLAPPRLALYYATRWLRKPYGLAPSTSPVSTLYNLRLITIRLAVSSAAGLYLVKMSRRHAGGHTIPDNPTWIEFPRSDGSASYLPKNTTKVVDSEGQVNFMRPVGMEESLSNLWRVAVGSAMATRLGMPSE